MTVGLAIRHGIPELVVPIESVEEVAYRPGALHGVVEVERRPHAELRVLVRQKPRGQAFPVDVHVEPAHAGRTGVLYSGFCSGNLQKRLTYVEFWRYLMV